jgi:hypothetical protein
VGVAARAHRKRRKRRNGLCCTEKDRKGIMVEGELMKVNEMNRILLIAYSPYR